MVEPRVLVFSSLFPSAAAPTAGSFIQERMLRVASQLPLQVVAPQPWSPADGLIRVVRRSYRPQAVAYETLGQTAVHRPRFMSVPGMLKRLDGTLMARGSRSTVRRLVDEFRPTVVDAHFVYPDGYAASILAREFGLPLTITLRGSKDEWLIGTDREPMMRTALEHATRIFSVSDALKRDVGLKLGQPESKILVVRNGVDMERFVPVDRAEARSRLGLSLNAKVIVGVGGLNERKGFHRVIPLIPSLAARIPELKYLIVGGGTVEADMTTTLQALAATHGVADKVKFCGPQRPEDLKWYYGAADVFALATSHEGWANVFLEAMACGLPVITTEVGGNAQVVGEPGVGRVVPFWNPSAFEQALHAALMTEEWDRDAIVAYAGRHGWQEPVDTLVREFRSLSAR